MAANALVFRATVYPSRLASICSVLTHTLPVPFSSFSYGQCVAAASRKFHVPRPHRLRTSIFTLENRFSNPAPILDENYPFSSRYTFSFYHEVHFHVLQSDLVSNSVISNRPDCHEQSWHQYNHQISMRRGTKTSFSNCAPAK